jgi:hypothetical protein
VYSAVVIGMLRAYDTHFTEGRFEEACRTRSKALSRPSGAGILVPVYQVGYPASGVWLSVVPVVGEQTSSVELTTNLLRQFISSTSTHQSEHHAERKSTFAKSDSA